MARHLKDKKKLSKHLLEMKFMKSSRDRRRLEEEEDDCRLMFYSNISDEMKSSSSKYLSENSYALCEGLKCGRWSCRGMNPELEKLLALENDDKSIIKKIKEEDVDVTVEEMVQFRQEESTLVETISKKFKKPKSEDHEIPLKKPKFMKPSED